MTTDTATRPAYRPFHAFVARTQQLSPNFTRVVFTGEDMDEFGTDGLDQRIKVLFPHADGSFTDIGQDHTDPLIQANWYAAWRELPEAARNPFRTYTVRNIDAQARELTIDFVVHAVGAGEKPGPAAAWLAGAQIGDELLIVGPTSLSPDSHIGIDWKPGRASEVLLAADETAVPAVCSILEALPAGVRAHAFCEVPSSGDVLPLTVGENVTITWLAREGREHGEALLEALGSWIGDHPELIEAARAERTQEIEEIDIDREILWDAPEASDSDVYAWLAGESALIKTLRRRLVSEHGVDRRRVSFMGYWRRGQAERQG